MKSTTRTDRGGEVRPGGVLCVVARHDDASTRFAPSLRWFARAGIRFHLLEILPESAGCELGPASAPLPVSRLELRLRCPLAEVPTAVLAHYVERAVEVTGADGLLTYRHASDSPQGRFLRDAVDVVRLSRGIPVWVRDRTPAGAGAALRPVSVPGDGMRRAIDVLPAATRLSRAS